MTPLLREAEHARVRDAALRVRVWPWLIIIGERSWWLFDPADYPGFTDAQIRAGLTVPATGDDNV